jgi:hypothetical protein
MSVSTFLEKAAMEIPELDLGSITMDTNMDTIKTNII